SVDFGSRLFSSTMLLATITLRSLRESGKSGRL
ncbi:MAG: hypothetical protein RL385_6117, partial [Pseudomonadota bacterium]